MTKEYQEIRHKIKTGDCYATASTALFSKIIRLFSRSHVSHIGIFVWMKIEDKKRLFIVESIEGTGVTFPQLASTRILSEKGKSFWGKFRSEESTKEIKEKIIKTIGVKYDMKGALTSLWKKSDESKFFCSEYFYWLHGIQNKFSKRGSTPDDVIRKCEKVFELK